MILGSKQIEDLRSRSEVEVEQIARNRNHQIRDVLLLTKLFNVTFGDVLRLRKVDVSPDSVRFRSMAVPWPKDSNYGQALKERVLAWAESAHDYERLYEQRKPVLKAITDIGTRHRHWPLKTFQSGCQTAWCWERNVAPRHGFMNILTDILKCSLPLERNLNFGV